MICSYCEQGVIYHANFEGDTSGIYLCDDCESVWFEIASLRLDPDSALYVEFKKRRLPEDWVYLTNLYKL